jgi:DNA-directed RNA polymerase specialized sigma24 family protein
MFARLADRRQSGAASRRLACSFEVHKTRQINCLHSHWVHRAGSSLESKLKQREIIALKIDGELTFAQIGEVLGISPNTAASRYRLALEKLRTALGVRVR